MTARHITLAAPAKVNLTLEVLRRREDGYHELASVMATIGLHDDVTVRVSRTLETRIRPDVGAARGEDLAARAARALATATGKEPRARIEIRKRIPVAAGLGGGSSDAGATLSALATLWRTSGVDLVRVGASVGSDVPFFVAGHPVARAGGRGEQIEALPAPATPFWIALVTLPVRLPTASVFAALDRAIRGSPAWTDALVSALRDGDIDPATIRARCHNDLRAAAERICQPIAEAREAAARRGIALMLSGSGPSMFAVADGRAHALRLRRSLRAIGLKAGVHELFFSKGRRP